MRRWAWLAVAAALVFAGCGGGDSGATSVTGAGGVASDEASTTPQGRTQGSPGASNLAPKNEKPSHPRGVSPTDKSPLPNEGTKAVAPGVPTTKGGDNSIQSYGVESDGSERAEAASALSSYLGALLAGDWPRACSRLVAETKQALEEIAGRAAQKKVGCPTAIASLISQVPHGPLRTLGEIHALSMRVQGDRGFFIYEDGGGKPSESAMLREDGKWRVRSLIAKELMNTGSLAE